MNFKERSILEGYKKNYIKVEYFFPFIASTKNLYEVRVIRVLVQLICIKVKYISGMCTNALSIGFHSNFKLKCHVKSFLEKF